MPPSILFASTIFAANAALLAAVPAHAADNEDAPISAGAEAAVSVPDTSADTAAPQSAPSAPPPNLAALNFKPVFDETWATIGIGAGLVPSYAGSDDYVAFPLPLIVGRVGGVGIRPNGAGLTLDLLSPKPAFGPRKTRVTFGPAFRIRNDRNIQIEDVVVEAAGELDLAVEVGVNAGIALPGVFKRLDTLILGAQVRWDVAGAHGGMIVEPQISYSSPIGRAMVLQVQAGLEFVDDGFADYYFSVSPAQSAASGLPLFRADGGLNRLGTTAILAYDLDRNVINGGWSVYGVGGYSRLVGDGADTPYTALRGDPNQFITGLGVGYTF